MHMLSLTALLPALSRYLGGLAGVSACMLEVDRPLNTVYMSVLPRTLNSLHRSSSNPPARRQQGVSRLLHRADAGLGRTSSRQESSSDCRRSLFPDACRRASIGPCSKYWYHQSRQMVCGSLPFTSALNDLSSLADRVAAFFGLPSSTFSPQASSKELMQDCLPVCYVSCMYIYPPSIVRIQFAESRPAEHIL